MNTHSQLRTRLSTLPITLLFALLFSSTMISAQTLHDYTLTDIDGNDVSFSQYDGKVVLAVNVASFCGYTRQYEPLQELYEKYKDQGLVVIGFPANDFGAQEPGTNSEIKEFCTTKFQVTFPMMSKVTVKGAGKHELFAWLTSGAGNEEMSGEIRWNFEKFLIDKNGQLIKRYATGVEPESEEVAADIEAALNS